MDRDKLIAFVNDEFEKQVLPSFNTYLTMPCLSQAFDKDWKTKGELLKAAQLLQDYATLQQIPGLKSEIDVEESPILMITIDPTKSDETFTILMYGHLDKQPAGEGWDSDKDPYKPVIIDDRLYARGSADDGYSFYSALTSIKAILNQGFDIPRIVIVIESSQESGSPDLAVFLRKSEEKIKANLIIGLDSQNAKYNNIWITRSLRGLLGFDMKVTVCQIAVHSGKYSGLIPDSFMIGKKLISKLETVENETVRIKYLEEEISPEVIETAKKTASQLGDTFYNNLPILDGVKLLQRSTLELYLNNTRRPSLALIGVGGVPKNKDAISAIRPYTVFRISIRLPPTIDPSNAMADTKKILLEKTPFSADVQLSNSIVMRGIELNSPGSKLTLSLNKSCKDFFNTDAYSEWGMGSAIPCVLALHDFFPGAEMILTGAAGVDSNIHQANENLYLPFCKSFTCGLASIISDYTTYKLGI